MKPLRVALLAIFTYLGFEFGVWLDERGLLSSPINLIYLTVVGALLGLLLAPRLEHGILRGLARLEEGWRRLPPELPLAVTAASVLALLAAVLLTTLLSSVPGFAWYHSLGIALVLVLVFSFVAVRNMHFFRPRGGASAPLDLGGKALDSSVLIDGRIAEMAELGWLEGPLWVPRFILRELQLLADQEDPVRRGKGRRGLETLERLRGTVPLEVIDDEVGRQELTDDKLLDLCRARGMALVTNDAAMVQLARIYDVKVLSVQALSIALRTQYRPGDRVELEIIKPGREPGQGVGYLEDGTMVVVDHAAQHRGRKVKVVITQTIQTQVGRLVFARLQTEAESGEGQSPSG
ncbi:PilT protein domain protein [Oceanithermus profundus DSM 14977]|uniref:PilT protein domain protein n=1 Tax=Oceanithermus profundus (strain DSM 14977 / NBRC 100410 / VKM B-2274 / 506) TaxID=670487 RepID=E4U7N1_OCEP5|nr:TRAM domain-containing protein [Oceanithermus profundus]ADR36480.1 PilT protein domain protein [Oceanithermus profundus DSM 14977]